MSAYLAEAADNLFVDGPSARFGYRRVGSQGGVPLVLLNRFGGTLDWWDPEFLEYLAADHDVIFFDHVGTGYSTGQPRDSVEAIAEGAVEFLEALGLAQADLLGWSLGGMVAQRVSLRRPDLVRRLIVAASTAGGQAPGAPPASERAASIMSKPDSTVDDVVALFFPETEAGRAHGYEHIGRVSTRLTPEVPGVSPEARAAGMAAIFAFASTPVDQVRSDLEAMTHPVLFAAGMKDWLIPAVASFFAVEHIGSSARLSVYSDAGHAFLFQHAKAFAAEVRAFLNA
ncbi:alpha/beta fold hydrolase [Streptomyces sp. DSM 15324]|uniref:alpha/beta fold hydrolase n=1 Tax=Streptomyces sp. DSM 15324 TaxID=1739111 RepID=UPI00074A8E9D|nr:alpha/beta hydrolase [Streptomyces sp. DSM 15324]KUO07294.1 hydrolase [Streptomyces sp. DSM 15324]